MNGRRDSRLIASPSFWRGVANGMRSPAGRSGFQTAYRRAVWPAAIGSFALDQWVRHVRLVAGEPRLSPSAELSVCMLGAVAMFAVVKLVSWLWHHSEVPRS